MTKLLNILPLCLITAGVPASAATLTALTSFRGDGWFAPGEEGYTFLGTGNNERGLAFSPAALNGTGSDQLYLVSRSGGTSVRILDAATGLETGTLDVTGIAGGTFAISSIGVADDGAIYATNLVTNANAATAANTFKVYRWATTVSTPAVVFNSALAAFRLGDNMAVTGSGASTTLVAGYGAGTSAPAFASINLGSGAGTTHTVTGVAVGDFRLGVTFLDNDTILATQGGTTLSAAGQLRLVDFVGGSAAATLIDSTSQTIQAPFTVSSERPLDYATVGGVPVLATIDTGSGSTPGNSTVRIYDMTDPANPVFLTSGFNTSGTLITNGNGVGSVQWGTVTGDTATLYAMSTNQGIQAFTFMIPEPSSALLGLAGLGVLMPRRRC